jgi:hypothetical protein
VLFVGGKLFGFVSDLEVGLRAIRANKKQRDS